ncbi:MAG TPA: queuosine salvage family protein [Thermomicrobiales bacterium]|jgi:hypothetical protein|nr:queuosine salvage family protein [Thermomicrobiales bacterium]
MTDLPPIAPSAFLPSQWDIPVGHDPLGILAGSRDALADATHVTIDLGAVTRAVSTMNLNAPPPAWDDGLHWRGDDDTTVAWVFVLDTLNFCFWAPCPEPLPRWRVRYAGRSHDGYRALVAALRRAMEDGTPLTEPAWLAEISDGAVAHLLRPDDEEPSAPIPLLPERGENLRELGRVWLRWQEDGQAGDRHPAAAMVAAAGGTATTLVRLLTAELSSFDDVAPWGNRTVPFHKRAQILVADLAGTYNHTGPGAFRDLDGLTAFADYKVPQVLRRLGILRYDETLSGTIARYQQIPPGSVAEVEIRAGTVWGCELVRQAILATGRPCTAVEVDWRLWDAGQDLPAGTEPYHRTPTIFY